MASGSLLNKVSGITILLVEDHDPSRDATGGLLRQQGFTVVETTTGAQWSHIKKDGTIIDVEVVWHELIFRGRHAFLALAKDITERKHAREALQESEQRFRMMADTAPVMIWVSGTDKGCTFSISPGWTSPAGLWNNR